MKLCFFAFSLLLLVGSSFAATEKPLSQETQEDIAKHLRIAAAHTEAAKCLASSKSDSECEGALLNACKGIAIGRFCGMKH